MIGIQGRIIVNGTHSRSWRAGRDDRACIDSAFVETTRRWRGGIADEDATEEVHVASVETRRERRDTGECTDELDGVRSNEFGTGWVLSHERLECLTVTHLDSDQHDH